MELIYKSLSVAINLYEEAPELGKKLNPTLQNNFRTLVDVAKETRTSMADTTGMSFPKINMGPSKGDFYIFRVISKYFNIFNIYILQELHKKHSEQVVRDVTENYFFEGGGRSRLLWII